MEIDRGEFGNFEEIIFESGTKPKLNLFKKINSNNYSLQFISINIVKENNITKSKIKILIENLKYFIFLRSFAFVNDDKNIFEKEDLLNLITNISKLYLIENIYICCKIIEGFTKNDKKFFANLIKDCKIDFLKESLIIKLNGDIFDSIFDAIFNK